MASVIGYNAPINLKALPTTATLNADDLFLLQDGATGELKAITKANLRTALGAGGVGFAPKNIVTAQKTDSDAPVSLLQNTPYNLSALTVTITPHTDTSKILLSGHIFGEMSPYQGGENAVVVLSRQISGGSETYIPEDPGSANPPGSSGVAWFGINYQGNADTTGEHASFQYIDSPATSNAVTYRVYLYQRLYYSVSFFFNRTVRTNSVASEFAVSFMKAEDDYQSLAATISPI